MKKIKEKTKVSERKFHKRVIKITVLSEDVIPESLDVTQVIEEMINGDYSGETLWGPDVVINGRHAAKELTKQGSDPGFFQLNEDGSDAE